MDFGFCVTEKEIGMVFQIHQGFTIYDGYLKGFCTT